jgi:protein SCO1/2
VGAIAAAMALAAGCGSTASGNGGADPAFRGDVLPSAVPLPALTLTDDQDRPLTLSSLQPRHVVLVYFGYTHCPDVCPTTMADLAVALRQAEPTVQQAVRVVFISSDPTRDTPAVLHSWLSNFVPSPAPRFIGLTGDIKTIDTAAQSVGVPLEPPVKLSNGQYEVDHGAQVLAFIDGRADHLWLAGTSPTDYGHDLALLVNRGAA